MISKDEEIEAYNQSIQEANEIIAELILYLAKEYERKNKGGIGCKIDSNLEYGKKPKIKWLWM